MQQDNLPDELGTLEEKAEAPLKPTGRVSTALPRVWVGYIIAAAFLIVEVSEVIIDPTATERITVLPVVIALGGWIYWLFCIYQMHRVIAEATNSYHPITPGRAVGYHFIPFYNVYWVFKWPNEIADFVNSRLPSKQMAKGWVGSFLLIGSLLGRVDAAISLAVTFSVGLYLTRKISNAIDMTPERVMRKVTPVGWGFWLWWVLASAMGGAVGLAVLLAVVWVMGEAVAGYGVVVSVGIRSLIGIFQWLVLRQQVSRAGWWVLASAVGVAARVVVLGAVTAPDAGEFVSLMGWVACVVVESAITGGALVWLLRQPVPEA